MSHRARANPDVRPRVRRTTATARVAACAIAAVVFAPSVLAQTPGAPEPEASGADPLEGAPSEAASDEVGALEGEQPQTPSAEVAPPSDIEVFNVKGRAVTALETEIPTSITQFDAAAIESLGAQNISDLAKVTPNLEIRKQGDTAATFFIRGVGLSDFGSNAASAVSIFQDDVNRNGQAIQLGLLYDIENVEVLKGPQSTGPNRNSSAGAIRISSRKPVGELSASLRSSLGSVWSPLAHDAFLQDYEGAIEFPIVEERLAARFAFRLIDNDPYMYNGCGNAPPEDERIRRARRTDPENLGLASICGEVPRQNQITPESDIPTGLPSLVGNQDQWAARGILRFQPPDSDSDWLLNFHGSRLDQLSTLGQVSGNNRGLGSATRAGYTEPDQLKERCELRGGILDPVSWLCEAPGGGNPPIQLSDAQNELAEILATGRPLDREPYRGDFDRVGDTTLDSWGVVLRGDWVTGPVDFKFVNGFDTYKRSRVDDLDFSPNVVFENLKNKDKAWQFYSELTISGELEDTPLRWNFGGWYLQEKMDATVLTEVLVVTNTTLTLRDYTQDLWSYGIWGGFAWDFLDDFTLEGGVRYNFERKRLDLSRTAFLGRTSEETTEATDTATWRAPTGTISLTYRFNDGVSAYWKYSRGFKAGHFNASATTPEDNPPAKPETIDAWETGFAGRWLENRLTLRGSLFHYNYTDYQVFFFLNEPDSDPVLKIINAKSAEVYGAELDMVFSPFEGWLDDPWLFLEGLKLSGNIGWLEANFLDFTNRVRRRCPPCAPVGVAGVDVDYSGNQLINSPRFKASGTARWEFDLGRWGTVIPEYNFQWTHDIRFDPTGGRGTIPTTGEPMPPLSVGQKAFFLHNVAFTYRTPEGNIEVRAWMRNILDTAYKAGAFDATQFGDLVINFPGQPRTAGVDISIDF